MTKIAQIVGAVTLAAAVLSGAAEAAPLSAGAKINFTDMYATPVGASNFRNSTSTADTGVSQAMLFSSISGFGAAGVNLTATVKNWNNYTDAVGNYLTIQQSDGGITTLTLTSLDDVGRAGSNGLYVDATGYLHSSTGLFDDTVAAMEWTASAANIGGLWSYSASGTVVALGSVYTPPTPAPSPSPAPAASSGVPEPFSMALVGAGLVGLGAARRRLARRRAA